jgi:hypothetical protein
MRINQSFLNHGDTANTAKAKSKFFVFSVLNVFESAFRRAAVSPDFDTSKTHTSL